MASELNEAVLVTAYAIKAFLEGFDPLGRTLERLVGEGNEVQVLVMARAPDVEDDRITYLIEISRGEEEGFRLGTVDRDLLRKWGIHAG